MINKPKIKPEERDKIAFLLTSKTSLREIARELGRSVSSISQEVKRNSFNGEYTSLAVQRLSEHRNKLTISTKEFSNIELAYCEKYKGKAQVALREKQLKGWSKAKYILDRKIYQKIKHVLHVLSVIRS